MRVLLGVGIAVALLGCGELENDPLQRGRVIGSVANAITSTRVDALSDPGHHSGCDFDGKFSLDLAAGNAELLVTSEDRALRVPVFVPVGEIVDVGVLHAPQGLSVTFVFTAPDGPVNGGRLRIEGTPLDDVRAPETTNEVTAGPFAPGCYEAEATASSREDVEVVLCVNTPGQRIEIVFGRR